MSTQQPFKFRHLDSIVGAFVLTAVAIVIITLTLIGSAKQWFTPRSTIKAAMLKAESVEFIEELAEGLRPGTPVEFSGQVVGEVRESIADDGMLRLSLHISDHALAQLHHGDASRDGEAKAVIKKPIAPFMGQTRVLLKTGSKGDKGWLTDDWHKYSMLTIDPPRDSTVMAMKVLFDLEANLGPMMASITGLVNESRSLVAEIRAQRLPQQAGELIAGIRERQVPQRLDALFARIESIAAIAEAAAGDARRISAGLADGKGVAGKALSDVQMGEDLAKLASDLRAITTELRKAAPAAPALADGAGALLDEVQRLVDGLNRHWLLKGYTEPGSGGRIAPSGIVAPPEVRP